MNRKMSMKNGFWFVLWELTKRELKRKVCKKFSGNLMELCLSVNAYGIGCCIILDYL